MIKRLLNLRGLFSNTKFLIVFSVILAIIFWIVVALEYTPIVQHEVENVPVKIDIEGSTAERLELKPYGIDNLKVDITVEGKRYEVGGGHITPDDFLVEAEVAYVDSAGEKALALKVTPKNQDAEFEIVSLSAEYVNVFFDREATEEIPVKANFGTSADHIASDGYYFFEDEVIVDKVKITGPQTEVSKIKEGVLDLNINTRMSKTDFVEGKLRFITDTEDEIKYVTIDGKAVNDFRHSALIRIYKEETLPVEIVFENEPSQYSGSHIGHAIEPSQLNVLVEQKENKDTPTSVKFKLNFNDISPDKNVFRFTPDDVANEVKVLDDQMVTVTIDAGDIVVETLSFTREEIADRVRFKDPAQADGYDIEFESISIDVCGSEHELMQIDEDELIGSIYLNNTTVPPEGKQFPVEFKVQSNGSWVTGTYYLTVKPK